MIEELARDLGFFGNSTSYDRILNGTYEPPYDADDQKDLLVELKH